MWKMQVIEANLQSTEFLPCLEKQTKSSKSSWCKKIDLQPDFILIIYTCVHTCTDQLLELKVVFLAHILKELLKIL